MATLNKVYLIGLVGRDPDVRDTEKGKVASFSLATTNSYKDKSGERHEETDWHTCVVWGPSAGYVEKYVTKGSSVLVEGRLHYRKYNDKNGDVKYVTEILASSIESLSRKRKDDEEPDDLP